MAGQIPPAAGGGTITIAGHKISKTLAIAGALASLVALFLVLRARSQGASTTVGTAPAPAANPAVNPSLYSYGTGTAADYSAALDNIETQLSSLQQAQATAQPAAPANTPAAAFHFGSQAPSDTGWQWLPTVASQYNLPTGVQPLGSAPTTLGAFNAEVGGQAVPLANSWGYV